MLGVQPFFDFVVVLLREGRILFSHAELAREQRHPVTRFGHLLLDLHLLRFQHAHSRTLHSLPHTGEIAVCGEGVPFGGILDLFEPLRSLETALRALRQAFGHVESGLGAL